MVATPALAGAAFRAGDYGEARRLYAGVVEAAPDDGYSHYMLGLAAWKDGDPRGALAGFDD